MQENKLEEIKVRKKEIILTIKKKKWSTEYMAGKNHLCHEENAEKKELRIAASTLFEN